MVQFHSVTKNYQEGITAIYDVSFQVEAGEFVFLVGPSGSGKTTIIKLLIRKELPSDGKIFFENEEITNLRRSHIYSLRRKIGVIFQDFKLIPELTAYENIAFAMEAAGKSPREIKENVPYLLDIVGLSKRMNSFPEQLSGGEKQRVAIARAMSNNPKLLIADEPTGNLDPDSAWDIVQILTKINDWGTTVLMSTHGSDFVNTLNKRVLRLEDGKLVKDTESGSYKDLDDYSIKILTSKHDTLQNKRNEKPTVQSDKETAAPEKTEKSKETKEAKKQKQALSEEQIIRAAKDVKIRDSKLNVDLKKKLIDNGYKTLADIIDAGMNNLSNIEGVTKTEVTKIAKMVKSFVNELQ